MSKKPEILITIRGHDKAGNTALALLLYYATYRNFNRTKLEDGRTAVPSDYVGRHKQRQSACRVFGKVGPHVNLVIRTERVPAGLKVNPRKVKS
jgi:hypothetical protein